MYRHYCIKEAYKIPRQNEEEDIGTEISKFTVFCDSSFHSVTFHIPINNKALFNL